jgi:hypothetical protein
MYKELKKAIIEWLLENGNQWQRVNACHDHFRQYVYTPEGQYCIGGEIVSDFISKADKLIYG